MIVHVAQLSYDCSKMAGYQKLDVVVANVNTNSDDVSEAGLTQGGKAVVMCPYVPDTHCPFTKT